MVTSWGASWGASDLNPVHRRGRAGSHPSDDRRAGSVRPAGDVAACGAGRTATTCRAAPWSRTPGAAPRRGRMEHHHPDSRIREIRRRFAGYLLELRHARRARLSCTVRHDAGRLGADRPYVRHSRTPRRSDGGLPLVVPLGGVVRPRRAVRFARLVHRRRDLVGPSAAPPSMLAASPPKSGGAHSGVCRLRALVPALGFRNPDVMLWPRSTRE